MKQPFRYRLIDALRGTAALDLLDDLREQQYWSASRLQAFNETRLADYFAELRRDIPLFRDCERFEDLPIIDKHFINTHHEALRNRNYQGRVLRKKTGGSTGEPTIYYTGAQSQSYLWAGLFLAWEVAGYRLGEKVVYLAGSALVRQGWQQSAFYRLMRVEVMSAFDMSRERMDDYALALQQRGYRLLYGYASAIHRLAVHVLQRGGGIQTTMRGIVCTGETMTERMRHDIEQAFGVPCFGQYGCNDAGVSAFECEARQGYHLLTPRCHAEVLDDGRLVSTDLSNQAMYLPRHDTGDLVKMSGRTCGCGRGFPLIDEVMGRQYDFLIDAAGNAMHYQFFMFLLREDRRIHSFQIVYDDETLVLNLHTVPLSAAEQAAMAKPYRDRIAASLVFDEIHCVFNQPYIVQANGKHRFMLRRSPSAMTG
jgi:phenylacetate-CoA ligase